MSGVTLADLNREIQTLFHEEVELAYDPPGRIPVQYDNDPKELPDTGLRCRFTIQLGEQRQVDMGAKVKRIRRSGVATAQFMDDVGAGEAKLIDVCKFTEQVFKAQVRNGIHFRAPSVVRVGRIGSVWQMNVVCPFYADNFQ